MIDPYNRRLMPLLVLGASLFVRTNLQADGLIRRLPKDGTWTRYSVSASSAGKRTSGHLRIASIGTETVNDQPARWIEILQSWDEDSFAELMLRVLIPERYLKQGEAPVEHIVEGHIEISQQRPRQTRELLITGKLEKDEGAAEARRHDGIPFGVALYRLVLPDPEGDEMTLELTLRDFGTAPSPTHCV